MTIKVKIPKRIGPVKIAKKVRRKAKKAIRMAEKVSGQDFATAAMAAARAGRRRAEGKSAPDQDGAGTFRCSGTTRIDVETAKVAEIFRDAAIDGFRRFLEGFEEGLRKAAETVDAEPVAPAGETPAEESGDTNAKPEPVRAKPKAAPRKPRPSSSAKSRRPGRPAPGA